ncbi:hypothetical protein KKH15_01540 [Patescibacteria group bacterium]|nr:hypothetical protein [Patescibacteria group bacterium]MBU1755325.1 hypothetical protein [Patescibacteria group bacterium]
MVRFLLAALLILLVPGSALAATVAGDRTVVLTEAPVDNTYLVGTDVTVTVPLPADLVAAGTSLKVFAPVKGDVMLAGATINVAREVGGDLRAVGGSISIQDDVAGDLILGGGSVTVSGKAKDIRIAGGSVRVTDGSTGPVTIYGTDVFLSGAFAGDVTVVASNTVTLGEGTSIQGALKYNASQQAGIPESVTVLGGVEYTGASTYLPTIEEAKTFALAGTGVFLTVKFIAALVLTGLLAGLFPVFTEKLTQRVLRRRPGQVVLLALLGFGIFVATPVFILLLLVSFVGIGLAVLLGILYALLFVLAYVYAAVLVGALIAHFAFKRDIFTWRWALLGVLALQILDFIPYVGPIAVSVLSAAAAGTIALIAYRFAFKRLANDPL